MRMPRRRAVQRARARARWRANQAGRRYSRYSVQTRAGGGRSTRISGSTFFCNVYGAPADSYVYDQVPSIPGAIAYFMMFAPADPYTLRLNTGINSTPQNVYTFEGNPSRQLRTLSNMIHGPGVFAGVVNARPPGNTYRLTLNNLGLSIPVNDGTAAFGMTEEQNTRVIVSYSGGNRVLQWGQYGQLYDRYMVETLTFEYIPSCSKMTNGQVCMLWNDNPTDQIPSTLGQFLVNTKCVTTQCYNRAKMTVHPRRWLWTDQNTDNHGVRSRMPGYNQTAPFTDRTVDCGWFAVCGRKADAGVSTLGTIRVHYVIRFAKPSINFPLLSVNADTGEVFPAQELVQAAMPGQDFDNGIQRAGPAPREGDENGPSTGWMNWQPQATPDGLVAGAGGNQYSVNNMWGSNFVGNPMYMFTDGGGTSGGGPGPSPQPPGPGPDTPVVPDDPIPPPEPDVPVSAMQIYSYVHGVPFYKPNDSGNAPGYIKMDTAGYQSPDTLLPILPYEHYGQSFDELKAHWPPNGSGATPVTPCSVVGFVTMIDNDRNMGAPTPGQVVALYGTNLAYAQKDTDSNTMGLIFSRYRFIYCPVYHWGAESPLKLLTGDHEVQFTGAPNQFYLAGEWQRHNSPSNLEMYYNYSGIEHDFMFMFLQSLHCYGVTYYGPASGRETRTYGVYRSLSSNMFPYELHVFGSSSVSTSLVAPVTQNVPVGEGVAGDLPPGDATASRSFNLWAITNGYDRFTQLGVFVNMHIAFTRVATPFVLQTQAYLACNKGGRGPEPLYALWGTSSPGNASGITWPPVIGGSGNAYVFASGQHQQIIHAFSTYDGLGDHLVSDDLQAFTTKGLAYALSFTCDLSKVPGSGIIYYVPSVMFHLGNAEDIGMIVSDTPLYSTDFETMDYTSNPNGVPPSNPAANRYFVAGAQFYIVSMKCVVYDPTVVPQGLSDAQLGQYLAANPSAVIMGSGM